MKVTVVAFGIAKDILQSRSIVVELNTGSAISDLKQLLITRFPELATLQSLSFAVGEDYQEDNYQIQEGEEIVILPPVSGG